MDAAPPAPKKTALHELNVEDDALVRDAALHAVASLQGEHWSFEGEEDVILTVGADAWRLCKPALHAIVKHTAAVVAEDVEAARAMVAVCVGAVGFATLISTRCKEQKKTSSCLNDTLPIQGVQDMDAVAFAGAPKSANAFSLKGITRYPVVKAALCVTHTFESPPPLSLTPSVVLPTSAPHSSLRAGMLQVRRKGRPGMSWQDQTRVVAVRPPPC